MFELTGPIPPEIGNLTSLENLYFFGTGLDGSLPPELGNLTNLRQLDITYGRITGSIPAELGNLSNLESLGLDHLPLTGTIPPELGNLSNLTGLGIGNTQVTGTIPPELNNLSNLRRLVLTNNMLTGAIPPELGELSQLKWLDLTGNQLTGTIPPELGNLQALTTLRLERNQLTGSIPQELGNLGNLKLLNLRDNPLDGALPRSFIWLNHLTHFYFSNTDICMPDDPKFTTWLNRLQILEDSGITCPPVTKTISPAGGTLTSIDGTVRIQFPAGTFATDTVVTYTHLSLDSSHLANVDRFFSLEATQNGVPITQAAVPMTITVHYPAYNPIISGTVQLYYFDGSNWLNDNITAVSETADSLTSLANQFTIYAVLGQTNQIDLPLIINEEP